MQLITDEVFNTIGVSEMAVDTDGDRRLTIAQGPNNRIHVSAEALPELILTLQKQSVMHSTRDTLYHWKLTKEYAEAFGRNSWESYLIIPAGMGKPFIGTKWPDDICTREDLTVVLKGTVFTAGMFEAIEVLEEI